MKLALGLMADADCAFDDEPLQLADALALSPLAWPLRYAYPVRQIGPDCQPLEQPAEATYLIACRDRNDRVRILASNAVTIRLLQLIDEGRDSRRCFEIVAAELGSEVERIQRTGLAALDRLHLQDVVVRAT